MKVSTIVLATLGLLSQSMAAPAPLSKKSDETICYDKGWSVNGQSNHPNIYDKAGAFCARNDGQQLKKSGTISTQDVLSDKKVDFIISREGRGTFSLDGAQCAEMFVQLIDSCLAQKSNGDLSNFKGGVLRSDKWAVMIDRA